MFRNVTTVYFYEINKQKIWAKSAHLLSPVFFVDLVFFLRPSPVNAKKSIPSVPSSLNMGVHG